jgi:hypothetical protein
MQAPLPDRAQSYARIAVTSELRVGAAEADISPDDLPYLGGFDLARRATAIDTPLRARALVVVAGPQKIAIVGVDNLGLERQDADWIKAGITGFPFGNVFLAASHTHAGPDLIGMWGYYFLTSGRDTAYLAKVRRGVAKAVADALAKAQPARLVRGLARVPERGLFKNPNRAGVFDRDLHVVQAQSADGAPLGTLLHLACHPEVLGRSRSELSADFVAMVTPDIGVRDRAGAAWMGDWLSSLADASLASATPVPIDAVEVRRRDVYIPMESFGLTLGRLTTVIPRPTHRGMLRSTVGYLRLGSIEICCVPGEMEPGLAERIRRLTGRPDLMVWGLVDDELGYLMAEPDARHPLFAYERSMSPSADSGERIVRALVMEDAR